MDGWQTWYEWKANNEIQRLVAHSRSLTIVVGNVVSLPTAIVFLYYPRYSVPMILSLI